MCAQQLMPWWIGDRDETPLNYYKKFIHSLIIIYDKNAVEEKHFEIGMFLLVVQHHVRQFYIS